MVAKGEIVPADPDHAADLFDHTRAATSAAGIPAYEISNHARPGQESRHNLAYWRYGDYLGVGPGAHGRRGATATLRRKKPENWLAAIASAGHGMEPEEALAPDTRAMEALLMGLRLAEGVDLARIAAESGVPIDRLVRADAIARLARMGLIAQAGTRLHVPERGMLLLDAILPEVVAV
jgi:coproporphyrinogen III oxidase-like Fe-S oxidoreductase